MLDATEFSFGFNNSKKDSEPSAFIFYSPSALNHKEQIFYNDEALLIISAYNQNQADKVFNVKKVSDLCSHWRALADNYLLENLDTNSNIEKKAFYIETIVSYRRRYVVRAVVLSNNTLVKHTRNYLFILERFTPENINLIKIIRQYNLSKREQEILQLLMKGYSNKEIAYELNLSLNTIKTYMRLLMNKFNVGNRSSIIADLLKKGG